MCPLVEAENTLLDEDERVAAEDRNSILDTRLFCFKMYNTERGRIKAKERNTYSIFATSTPPPPPSTSKALLTTTLFSFFVFILSVWQVEVWPMTSQTHDLIVPWYRVCTETSYGVWEGLLAIRTFLFLQHANLGKFYLSNLKELDGHFIRSYKLKYREYALTYFSLWQSKKGEFLLLKRKKYANGSKSIFVFFDFLFDIYAKLTRFLILVAVVQISLKKHAPLHLF
jgi:hypothetical protein